MLLSSSILRQSLLLLVVALGHSYHVSMTKYAQSQASSFGLQASPSSWPGNRPPVNSPQALEQRMDAVWGRGKFRTEVWEDNPNPLNDWWLNYEPSQEQVEAAEQGFDFQNAKEWCEVIPTICYGSDSYLFCFLHLFIYHIYHSFKFQQLS